MASPLSTRRGIDILADIMRFTEPKCTHHILTSLAADNPRIAAELRRRLVLFEDLAYADPRGVRHLLKLTTLRDLALAMKGAPAQVLLNLANNMSKRSIEDLREEITFLGPTPSTEIDGARARIMKTVNTLLASKELYFTRGDEGWKE